jgi:hypothetical protein
VATKKPADEAASAVPSMIIPQKLRHHAATSWLYFIGRSVAAVSKATALGESADSGHSFCISGKKTKRFELLKLFLSFLKTASHRLTRKVEDFPIIFGR